MTLPPSRTADKIMIRLPDGMRERLTAAAEEAGRSVNAEVVARLEASFVRDEEAAAARETIEDHDMRIRDLERELEKLADVVGYRERYR